MINLFVLHNHIEKQRTEALRKKNFEKVLQLEKKADEILNKIQIKIMNYGK